MTPFSTPFSTSFSVGAALAGGALIGLSASLLLLLTGRVAGVSGALAGLVRPRTGDWGWRATFLLGLVVGGVLLVAFVPGAIGAPVKSPATLAVAGVLVGFGTRMGGGCTSGHGVCGLARFSSRSLAAVLAFMTAGALVASLLVGGPR